MSDAIDTSTSEQAILTAPDRSFAVVVDSRGWNLHFADPEHAERSLGRSGTRVRWCGYVTSTDEHRACWCDGSSFGSSDPDQRAEMAATLYEQHAEPEPVDKVGYLVTMHNLWIQEVAAYGETSSMALRALDDYRETLDAYNPSREV